MGKAGKASKGARDAKAKGKGKGDGRGRGGEGDAVDPNEAKAAWIFASSLLLSLVVGVPVFGAIVEGTVSAAEGLLRWLVALGLSWLGVAGLVWLYAHFSAVNAPPPGEGGLPGAMGGAMPWDEGEPVEGDEVFGALGPGPAPHGEDEGEASGLGEGDFGLLPEEPGSGQGEPGGTGSLRLGPPS